MPKFAQGGIVSGTVEVRMVPDCSPDGKGRLDVIYADECIIGPDKVCRRTDDWHKAAPITSERFWTCPSHDTKQEPTKPRCPRCGSLRWVSVSLDAGWTHRAQCVPCGAYHRPVIGPGWKAKNFRDPEAVHPDYRDKGS